MNLYCAEPYGWCEQELSMWKCQSQNVFWLRLFQKVSGVTVILLLVGDLPLIYIRISMYACFPLWPAIALDSQCPAYEVSCTIIVLICLGENGMSFWLLGNMSPTQTRYYLPFWVLFWIGSVCLLHFTFLLVPLPSVIFFSPQFFLLFSSFVAKWVHRRFLHLGDVQCFWPAGAAAAVWAFIKAVLRNDHSAMGKLSWPRGQSC